jgi:hypothetical protein
MIRLSLLQSRAQAVTAATALVIVAITLGASGPHLYHLYDTSGFAVCQAQGACASLATAFLFKLSGFYAVIYFIGFALLLLAPAVLGMFWGAPLITREFETGTFQLAWTQSITRARWLAVKLGVGALTAMATAGLFSLMLTWWSGPIDTALPLEGGNDSYFTRFGDLIFPARGIAPVGYAAFAFMLGAAVGALIRRTLPAMAVTLGGFAFIQVNWALWIRGHLIAPVHTTIALTAANITELVASPSGTLAINPPVPPAMARAWIISSQTIQSPGRQFNVDTVSACRHGTLSQACASALGRLHLTDVIAYQPAIRFWAFQWYETAIFLAAALALAGLCFWSTRSRRPSR